MYALNADHRHEVISGLYQDTSYAAAGTQMCDGLIKMMRVWTASLDPKTNEPNNPNTVLSQVLPQVSVACTCAAYVLDLSIYNLGTSGM